MEAGSNFAVEVLDATSQPCVSFTGELDVAAADLAWSQLEPLVAGAADSLVIDLSGVTFIDSRGLSVLIRAWTALGSKAGAVTLRGAAPRIRRTLEVAGVDHAFTIS